MIGLTQPIGDAMARLPNQSRIDAYRRDGYVFPVPALSPDEARAYRAALERFEAQLGTTLSAGPRHYRSRTYLLFDWAQHLVRHPAILDAVEDLIGPDILVFTSTWFIKEPGTVDVAGWHQDATHFGLDPNDAHVTAWLALADAAPESGCMQFVPGSHRRGQLAHGYGLRSSVNDAGQWIPEPGDVATTADCRLRPGEFSLHNTLAVHRSGPNHSTDRRIGIGISYIPTSVRHTGSQRHPAHLVRGVDRYGHFDLDPAPAADFDAAAQAVHAASFAAFSANYAEQVTRHSARAA
jgi:non-heme Fe2+,alpha-ketoglutarate-dependent halogenase